MGLSHSRNYRKRNYNKFIENNLENPLLTRINDTSETIEVFTDVIDVDNNVSTRIPNGIKDYPNRSLHDWSLYGNYEEVIWLIKNGSNVNEMDEDGRTPLYLSLIHI